MAPGPPVRLVTWADERPSGGNVYNAELTRALRALGMEVEEVRVPGAWPEPDAADLAALAEVLTVPGAVLLDGIVGCAAPAEVARAEADVAVLVHMSLTAPGGLSPHERAVRAAREAMALRAARAVVCPSEHAARDLRERYGVEAVVARPGVRVPAGGAAGPARVPDGGGPPGAETPGRGASASAGSLVPHLLCVGAVTPDKAQLDLVRALAQVADLAWDASLVGGLDVDPVYAGRVLGAVEAAGLEGRVRLIGPLTGAPLEEEWARADLLVVPSCTETFGLVVLEGIARGVPALVRGGTGAVEALYVAAGRLPGPAARHPRGNVPPDDTPHPRGDAEEGTALPGAVYPATDGALAPALRTWLTDGVVRAAWADRARAAAPHLPQWDETARAVREVLTAVGHDAAGPTASPHRGR